MDLIDRDLLKVLEAYTQGWIGVEELRRFLMERYFPLPLSLNPFERMVVGELELRLAEMDRGDREEADVRSAARLFVVVFSTLLHGAREPIPA